MQPAHTHRVSLVHPADPRFLDPRFWPPQVLTLDKKSFLDLDRSTLSVISENARYNAACTKDPGQRQRDDLQILQQRTAHLSHLASLPTEVHWELW